MFQPPATCNPVEPKQLLLYDLWVAAISLTVLEEAGVVGALLSDRFGMMSAFYWSGIAAFISIPTVLWLPEQKSVGTVEQ